MIFTNKQFAEIFVCTAGINYKARAIKSLTLTFVITCFGKDERSLNNDDKQGEFTHFEVTFLRLMQHLMQSPILPQ